MASALWGDLHFIFPAFANGAELVGEVGTGAAVVLDVDGGLVGDGELDGLCAEGFVPIPEGGYWLDLKKLWDGDVDIEGCRWGFGVVVCCPEQHGFIDFAGELAELKSQLDDSFFSGLIGHFLTLYLGVEAGAYAVDAGDGDGLGCLIGKTKGDSDFGGVCRDDDVDTILLEGERFTSSALGVELGDREHSD